MANPLNFIAHAVGQDQARTIYAEVSATQPLPASPNDPLFVVMPDWSQDYYFEIAPGMWKAEHGATLPVAGTACLLMKDPRENLWCVAWAGVYS